MKIYRNTATIERKEKRGRRISLIGLGILFIGLLASFVPTWLPPTEPATTPLTQFLQQHWTWISFIALPIGFICASIGSYYINRFARRRWKGLPGLARPDEVLERSLKGFDNKYAYFAWSLPAHYAVVGPCGVIIFAARSDRGRVTVQGDKWREPFSIGRIFMVFAREGLGNPAGEVEEQASKLRALLATNGATKDRPYTIERAKIDLTTVPIAGAAVFLNPELQLSVENPNMPVLRTDQVKEYVRRQAKQASLPAETLRALTERLVSGADYDEE